MSSTTLRASTSSMYKLLALQLPTQCITHSLDGSFVTSNLPSPHHSLTSHTQTMSRHGHHSPEEASRADDRSRSRSPHRKHHHHHRSHRHRSLSPSHHSHHHHSRTHRRKQTPPPATAAVLPYNEPHLSKHDLSKHRALFGLYLDVQKRLDIDGLEEDERRGRWKSFVGKWCVLSVG